MKNCFWGWIERPENMMWKCDKSFWVVKIVMATENCENFLHQDPENGENWEKSGENWSYDCAVTTKACAFHVMTKKFSVSIHFQTLSRWRNMRFIKALSDFLAVITWLFIFSSSARDFSLSIFARNSRDFLFVRVELEFEGFFQGACDILKQDTLKHVVFPETETKLGAREKVKNSLKNVFRRGFLLNFPAIFEIFPVFRGVGMSWGVERRPEKSTWSHPKSMCFP